MGRKNSLSALARRVSRVFGIEVPPDPEDNKDEDDDSDTDEDNEELDEINDDDNDETARPPRERVYNTRKNKMDLKIGMKAPRRDSLMVYRMQSPSSSPHTSDPFTEDSTETKVMFDSPEDPLSPTHSILKHRQDSDPDGPFRTSLYTILSGIYAMIIVVMGAVLPISEIFADVKHPILAEIFYSYLFLVSIAFLCYTYLYLLRTKKWKVPSSIRRRVNSASSAQKPELGLSSSGRKHRHKKVSMDQVSNHHTGSFYLRLGAMAFGIGSMIQSGLHFGMFFGSEKSVMFAITPVLHLIFTFIQLYFIFQNSKMCINRFKTLARFGLMHMVASNMCVWFHNIIEETLREIEHHYEGMHHDGDHGLTPHTTPQTHNQSNDHAYFIDSGGYFVYNYTLNQPAPDAEESVGRALMMDVVATGAPYLYPCSIEYSLISAGVLYVMWRHIGKSVVRRRPASGENVDETRLRVQRMSVDCSHSSRGLFLGILVIVATIISMVVFFVLVTSDENRNTAVLIEHLSEIVLYVLSTVAILFAFRQMHQLGFSGHALDLEESLILVSLTGEYIYAMFSIIAAWFDQQPYGNALTIVSCVFGVFQSTLQSVFLLNGLRRTAHKPEHERLKPGREFVMFLLMSNIAMWGINTFEVQRADANPVQIHYYGPLAWNILVHISVPLSIFFRFHSTVCISNIWKTAWKRKV